MKLKIASFAVAFVAILGLLAAAPTSKRITRITTTQGDNVFLPVGYNTLVCDGWVHYKMVTTSTGTVATTDPMVKGSAHVPSIPIYLNVSAGTQYLALLLDNGSPATCSVSQPSSDGQTGSFTTLAVSGQTTLSGFTQGQDAGINNIKATGTISADGALTSAGVISGIFDGGAYVGTTINTSGAAVLGGALTVTGDSVTASTKTRGNCTLNNASPSVCTAIVNTGAICVCANNTTTTNDVKCAVSSTTLTVTGPNTTTDVVSYICLQ